MAKIHGSIYLGIGIFVALVSYFSKNPSLRLFLYIGSIFGIIGIIKIFKTDTSMKKKRQAVRQQQTRITHQQYPRTTHRQQPIPTHKQPRLTKYCSYCGNMVRISDNFCSRCGTALRRKR